MRWRPLARVASMKGTFSGCLMFYCHWAKLSGSLCISVTLHRPYPTTQESAPVAWVDVVGWSSSWKPWAECTHSFPTISTRSRSDSGLLTVTWRWKAHFLSAAQTLTAVMTSSGFLAPLLPVLREFWQGLLCNEDILTSVHHVSARAPCFLAGELGNQ